MCLSLSRSIMDDSDSSEFESMMLKMYHFSTLCPSNSYNMHIESGKI